MTFSICIGAYKLADFVELNIRRCRTIFGADTPILISDNVTAASPDIKAMAENLGCVYRCGTNPYSHFSGDVQSSINALALAEATGRDIALKLSMRIIPVLPRFKEAIEEAFADGVDAVLPSRPLIQQMARPRSRFYSKFGLLSDIVAIRRGALTPAQLMDCYRTRCAVARRRSDSLVETTWGWLLAHHFNGRFRLLDELSRYKPFEPKILLRKGQCTEDDYAKVGAMEGMTGRHWDLREWAEIEGKAYFCSSRAV